MQTKLRDIPEPLATQSCDSRQDMQNEWLPRQDVGMHLKIIGSIYAGTGVILLLASAALFISLQWKRDDWFRSPADLLIILGEPLAAVLALLAIIMVWTGVQLTKLKTWTPAVIMALSCLGVFLIPIGPLWFGYCVWVLTNRNTEAVFNEQRL